MRVLPWVTMSLLVSLTSIAVYESVYSLRKPPEIHCTANKNTVKLYNKRYTSAKIKLTCNGQEVIIEGMRVGYTDHSKNKRVYGKKLQVRRKHHKETSVK